MCEDSMFPAGYPEDGDLARTGVLSYKVVRDVSSWPFRPPAYRNDCGLDLAIAVDTRISPGGTVNVPTGVAVALPPSTFGWVVARSSTWTKYGLLVLPGIIDEGWRGELFVMMHRPLKPVFDLDEVPAEDLVLAAGTRLGQLLVLPNLLEGIQYDLVRELPEGSRGLKGFGSSGA